jgi:hypothetical protein
MKRLILIALLLTATLPASQDGFLLELMEQQEIEATQKDEEALQAQAEEDFTDMDCQILEEAGKFCGDTSAVVANPFKEASK